MPPGSEKNGVHSRTPGTRNHFHPQRDLCLRMPIFLQKVVYEQQNSNLCLQGSHFFWLHVYSTSSSATFEYLQHLHDPLEWKTMHQPDDKNVNPVAVTAFERSQSQKSTAKILNNLTLAKKRWKQWGETCWGHQLVPGQNRPRKLGIYSRQGETTGAVEVQSSTKFQSSESKSVQFWRDGFWYETNCPWKTRQLVFSTTYKWTWCHRKLRERGLQLRLPSSGFLRQKEWEQSSKQGIATSKNWT